MNIYVINETITETINETINDNRMQTQEIYYTLPDEMTPPLPALLLSSLLLFPLYSFSRRQYDMRHKDTIRMYIIMIIVMIIIIVVVVFYTDDQNKFNHFHL